MTLPAGGRYAFRYLRDGGEWHDDDSVARFEANGDGCRNSILET